MAWLLAALAVSRPTFDPVERHRREYEFLSRSLARSWIVILCYLSWSSYLSNVGDTEPRKPNCTCGERYDRKYIQHRCCSSETISPFRFIKQFVFENIPLASVSK